MNYLLVAVGRALGDILRYHAPLMWASHIALPAWGATLIINIIGSFLIRLLMSLTHHYQATWCGWSLLLVTGFC